MIILFIVKETYIYPPNASDIQIQV